jgi:hypothetical protein
MMKGIEKSQALTSNPLIIFMGLLIGLTFVLMVPQLARLPYRIVINYNEGWNAYHASRALQWGNLYEPGEALIQNNYPPLSFYLVGIAGRLLGDDLFAGRWVSILSLWLTGFNIFLAALLMTRSWLPSLFCAVFFTAFFSAYYADYVGMNDPQMLAHLFMTSSLVVLVRSGEGGYGWMGAAVLMVVAGLIKHNVVAFPLAVTAFWALQDRKLFLNWVAFCLGLVVTTSVLLHVFYGAFFFSGVLASRVFGLSKVAEGLCDLGPPLLLPLAVWILGLLCSGKSRENLLILLYVAFSAVTGFIFYGGQGVSVNALFDLLIAVSLGAGVALAGFERAAIAGSSSSRRILWAASLALVLVVLPPLRQRCAEWEDIRGKLETLEEETLADVSYLRELPGPALCMTLELGYWSGKVFAYDPFNMWQAVQMGRMDEDVVFERIRNHYYGVVQLESISCGSPEAFPTHLLQQVSEYYVLDRRSVYGFYFIPKVTRILSAG